MLMDVPSREFVLARSLEELKARGRLVLHGSHRPILVIYDRGRVFALDNRCPHMGFPLERGSVGLSRLFEPARHAANGLSFSLAFCHLSAVQVEIREIGILVRLGSHRARRQARSPNSRGSGQAQVNARTEPALGNY
jgi:hypothetical protein